MTFMRKILDKLKLDSTIKIEDEQKEETLQEKEPISKKTKSPLNQGHDVLDVEKYAVMCNAYLEHQEEMEQYQHFEQQRSIEEISTPDAQTIYFKDGKLYKVYPTDEESWYDARYLVSDGKTYDLENIRDIQRIPIPRFAEHDFMMKGYGITGSLDYVIKMKAGSFYNRKEKELCSVCLWKSTELMLANKAVMWQRKEFDRLINWHLQLGMYEEAEKAKKYLSTFGQYTENTFDHCAKSIRDSTFNHAKQYGFDLVAYHDHGGGCCAECAKMRGRVYSISGKNKKFPPLPKYAKENGNFHPGCRCTMTGFMLEEEEIFYKGNRVKAIKASKRPWVDDRDKREIDLYENYLKSIADDEKKDRDREEYYKIVKNFPDIAPKFFGAYRRMKNSKSQNFMKIVDAAKQAGIVIDLEE